jgi:murein DD-endopeptidase MepM/ murein hydrolase activator NlpD
LWNDLVNAGWREVLLRYASHLIVIVLMLAVIGLSQITLPTFTGFSAGALANPALVTPAQAVPASVSASLAQSASAPVFGEVVKAAEAQVGRLASPHTLIATRGRTEVFTYTVQSGDTLFGIAERFNLKPETILWGNYFTLKDDPHLLRPDQVLNILPVDGTYHFVTEGNTVEQIARFYRVTPETIVTWPGNALDPDAPGLIPNTYVVVPGGTRASQAWVPPTIPRGSTAGSRPASNFGQCAGGYTGILGAGTFVWPTQTRTLSGFDYTAIHRGIDIRAATGDPIFAADSGVVTYANWNDWGYGNLVMIDHGNGWETVYAHLSSWGVQCGQSVTQGALIGQAGATGRASGPHLHFEVRYNGAFTNPWTVLPP